MSTLIYGIVVILIIKLHVSVTSLLFMKKISLLYTLQEATTIAAWILECMTHSKKLKELSSS